MARNPNTRDDVARPQDAKPRVRRADDQICLGQRNDAAPSNHASPQKTGASPLRFSRARNRKQSSPFLFVAALFASFCLLSDRLKLAFINAIYFKKGTGKRGAATAAGEQRRQGSSSKGSICANDTQTRIFGKQQAAANTAAAAAANAAAAAANAAAANAAAAAAANTEQQCSSSKCRHYELLIAHNAAHRARGREGEGQGGPAAAGPGHVALAH